MQAAAPPPVPRPDVQYETVLSYEQLDAWLAKIGSADLTSIDTETTSLDPMSDAAGRDLAVGGAFARLLHSRSLTGTPVHRSQLPLDDVLEQLRPWLESSHQRKVGHDTKRRHACVCQSRHSPGRYRARHAAAVVRARSCIATTTWIRWQSAIWDARR